MHIVGDQSAAVIDRHIIAAACVVSRLLYCPGKRCHNARSVHTPNIESPVIRTRALCRRNTRSKIRINPSVTWQRPDHIIRVSFIFYCHIIRCCKTLCIALALRLCRVCLCGFRRLRCLALALRFLRCSLCFLLLAPALFFLNPPALLLLDGFNICFFPRNFLRIIRESFRVQFKLC